MAYIFSPNAGWFTIAGYGLQWARTPPLFSERNGYRVPFARIGPWRLFWLRPSP